MIAQVMKCIVKLRLYIGYSQTEAVSQPLDV